MTHNLTAKKETGLGDLFKGYQPQQVEEQKKAIVTNPSPFAFLLNHFEKIMELNQPWYEDKKALPQYLRQEVTTVLSPSDISVFSNFLFHHVETNRRPFVYMGMNSNGMGILLTQLLQNSYDAGNNQFHLQLPMKEEQDSILGSSEMGISHLGRNLHGKKEQPLQVQVSGYVGNWFLEKAKYVHAVADDVGAFCGSDAKHIRATMKNADDLCGVDSYRSSFTIEEKANWQLGRRAFFSSFDVNQIEPPSYSGLDPYGCTFRTSNEESLHILLQQVPLGNRTIFTHPNGQQETLYMKHAAERIKYFFNETRRLW